MRFLILILVMLVGPLGASISLAQNRSPVPRGGFTGPAGGGTPTFNGPVGGGTPTRTPSGVPVGGGNGNNGNPDPGNGGVRPGTPPFVPGFGLPTGGTGTPGQPGAPLGGPQPGQPGPLPADPRDPNGRPLPPRSRTPRPYGLPYSFERWENWWFLNRARYLDVTRRFASRSRSEDINSDSFLGASLEPELLAPIFLNREETLRKLLPAIRALLADTSEQVRGEAALALGKVGGAESVPALVKMARDGNRFVRQMALLGLGLTRDPAAFQPLAAYLTDRNAQSADRAHAALGLGILGSAECIIPLTTVLHRQSGERNLKAASIYALGFIDEPDAASLLLQHSMTASLAGDLRAVAVLALGKQADSSHVDVLIGLLRDPEAHVRRSATLALGQLSYRSKLWTRRDGILEDLKRWERDRTLGSEARRRLEDHLAHMERRATEETRSLSKKRLRAVIALTQKLDRDRDHMVRRFAAIALGRIGSPEARIALAKEFKKSGGNNSERGFLALGLGLSKFGGAKSSLRQALSKKGTDPSTRSALALALGLLEDQNAGPALVGLSGDGHDPMLRMFAATAVGIMNYHEAKEPFRRALDDKTHAFLRPVFGLALGLLGDGEALEKLEQLALASRSSVTQVQAVQALASIRDVASVDVLINMLKRDSVTNLVRSATLHAIGEIGEKGVLPGLEPLARDWNYLLPFPVLNLAILR